MEAIELVVKISKEDYERLKEYKKAPFCSLTSRTYEAIANGIPLPKGHGRLIDESDLIPDSDYEDGMFYAVSIGQINGASTIIEADTAEKTGAKPIIAEWLEEDIDEAHT